MLAIALAIVPLSAQEKEKEKRKVGTAILTYYWIVDETSSKYDRNRDVDLLDRRGRVIAKTNARFRKEVALEGTGWLRDGRTIRFDRLVKGDYRFRVIKSRYGITANGCPAEPYRTAAVDPRFVKLGSKIYIPALKGTLLPDGTKHDGIFIAHDRGAFRGAHVDIFVGIGAEGTRPFNRHGNRSRSKVSVYLEGSRVRRCR